MSEKKSPTYDLESIQLAFSTVAGLKATGSSIDGASALALTKADMVKIIQSIKRVHLHKSLTSHKNHRIWQDVYLVPYQEIVLYIKFTLNENGDFLLISFKEQQNDYN